MPDDGDQPIPSFEDSTQEAVFWKKRAQELRELLDEAHQSLSEFEASSKELEEEMDKDLAHSNQQLQRAKHDNERLSQEVQQWKEKYQTFLNNRNKESAETNKELIRLRETAEVYRKKLRDIELDNDDLEMAERMVRSTLEDVESRYHQQMEKTTLMEQEIIDKLQLEETNQRLKDEIRELTEELGVLREREQQPPGTPSSIKSDEMTLSELTSNTKPRVSRVSVPPRSSTSIAFDLANPSSSSAGRAGSGQTTLKPRTSLALRTTGAHSRTISRDTDSPTLASRQNSLATTIRSNTALHRTTPPTQTRTSTKMARDLHTRIGTLQSKLGTSLHPNSRIPRPSLNLGASVSAVGMNTPLRVSTATIASGKTPTSSSDALRQSHIPLPSSSLRKSIGRPSARFSMPQAVLSRDTMTPDPNSDDSASDGRLGLPPRSSTPTLHSARARRDTAVWSSDTLQPGRRADDGRPSSVADTSPSKRATSPLHFLNTDPQMQHYTRPSSRPSMSASVKDASRNGRTRSQYGVSNMASDRPLQRANSISEASTARRSEATTGSSIDSHRPGAAVVAVATRPRVSRNFTTAEERFMPSRSDSRSTTSASTSGRSSVSAFRESRAHRALHAVSAGTGPPPVAHTGLKRIIAAPPTPAPAGTMSSSAASLHRGRDSAMGMASAPGSRRASFEQITDRG